MFGYWETGSTRTEMMPASTIRIAITVAKIGLLMQNWESMASVSAVRRRHGKRRVSPFRDR